MIQIDCFIDKIWKKQNLTKTEIKKIIQQCLKETNRKTKNVFLNVSFVNKQTMIEYNSKYRNKNNETNVLSFENKEQINLPNFLNLGEMVLCFEKIQQEAQEYNKNFKDRLYHLFIHSILHLLGYDHIEEKEKQQMEQLEENILKKFNIYNPYIIEE